MQVDTISAMQDLHKNSPESKIAFVINIEHNRERLERIQQSCTKIVLPESEYPDRLAVLNMAMLSEFLFELSWSHFIIHLLLVVRIACC